MKIDLYIAIGRRKESVARVRLMPGKGEMKVNKRGLEDYFKRKTLLRLIMKPFDQIEQNDKYDVIARVHGGGLSGQAGALQLGIARALSKIDADFQVLLRKGNLLTRDSRMVERKKYGQKGARKRFQFSKR